ncbi:VOC family protein [Leucobacter soli]|uniref:Glyoxalase/fosfomycin resistance/dioxygenase domain-containing protein n=1 Tax=Leucobacter soli TaxID=2812850 RepID=A0A916JTL5_9MICO|nr:VOC family protein [Leucobacter soli]CAG7600125.1 hypothetical protein LEUCIP111803_00357 [Leucobacter soli]
MNCTPQSRLLTELRTPILRSTRPELARDFYNGVLGDRATVLGTEQPGADEQTWGIILPAPAEAGSQWLPHAVSDDLASVQERVHDAGGTICREAALFESMLVTAPDQSQIIITERAPGEPALARELRVMLELCTREIDASCGFYSRVLDLTQIPVPGDPYSYRVLFSNDIGIAGAVDMTTFFRETTVSHWIPYFQVDDIERAVETSVAYGARVTVPIDESFFDTRYATLTDPTGATFGMREQPRVGGVFGSFSRVHGRFLSSEELAEQGEPGAIGAVGSEG